MVRAHSGSKLYVIAFFLGVAAGVDGMLAEITRHPYLAALNVIAVPLWWILAVLLYPEASHDDGTEERKG